MKKRNKKNQGYEIKAKNYVESLNPAKLAGKVIRFVERAGSNTAGFLTALDLIFLTLFFRGRPTITMPTKYLILLKKLQFHL